MNRSALRVLCLLLATGSPLPLLHAQAAPSAPAVRGGTLTGQVADPSGAVIPGATVSVTDAQGHTVAAATSRADGSYTISNVPPGSYVVLITAKGFGAQSIPRISIAPSGRKTLDATLVIQVQQQNVQVNAGAPTVSVDPDANANSIVLKGKDLDALSDDPDELSDELTALAGPGAGPSGGQIFIDGFTAGQLPPKSAIREIRINQNPYGAQFDKLGYGRVEIFTKPGTDKLHGDFYIQGNARQLNTGNPFEKTLPDYDSYQYEATLSGPINKNASFFFTAQHRNIQDDSIISTYRLLGENNGDFANGVYNVTSDYGEAPFSNALFTPQSRTNISPRVDLQLGQKNTLTIRYQYERNVLNNQGVGQNSLTSQAYNSTSSESTIQISHTLVYGPRVITETHLQLLFDRSSQQPANTTPTVQVQGNETFGGSSDQFITDNAIHYEVSNLTELALNKHSISLGGRLRDERDANSANSNFNGTFTFGQRTCSTAGCPINGATNPCQTGSTTAGCTPITAIQSYALTLQGQQNGQTFQQIQQAGGGPAQLVYVTGSPKIEDTLADGALFYQDDWKYRPNLTLSYGLRWETQNDIHDHSDWAPRLALAYGIQRHGKPTKDVIRAGFGYFYDRFGLSDVLQADRVNGTIQREIVLQNPTCYFPNGLPDAATVTADCGGASSSTITAGNSSLSPAIYQINPNLHAAANIQESIGLDHQLTKTTTTSLTFIHSHGVHAYDTINANAPYAPAYNPALGNVYQYFSEGVYNQNQLFFNFRTQISHSLSAFGFYGLDFADADVNGVSSNPSNSQNLKLDYGRAGFDTRNRLFLIGSYAAPHNFRFSPFLVAQSGEPFNITLSQDQNSDSFFNDRPSFAAGSTGSNVDATKYGAFNTAPATGATPIPVNYGNGPSLFTLNLRVSKTWGFGRRLVTEGHGGDHGQGGGPPSDHGGGHHSGGSHSDHGGMFGDSGNTGRRYNLTINAQALNLFNIVNYAPPNGVLDSRLFGVSNALAGHIFSSTDAARRIYLQARFTF